MKESGKDVQDKFEVGHLTSIYSGAIYFGTVHFSRGESLSARVKDTTPPTRVPWFLAGSRDNSAVGFLPRNSVLSNALNYLL